MIKILAFKINVKKLSSYLETRKCSGNGCTGPIKRYSSCNTHKCPRGSEDFRSMQCSKFNTVPFERKLYEWIPYLKAPRKCELNCMPKGERFYYRHNKTVSKQKSNTYPHIFKIDKTQ